WRIGATSLAKVGCPAPEVWPPAVATPTVATRARTPAGVSTFIDPSPKRRVSQGNVALPAPLFGGKCVQHGHSILNQHRREVRTARGGGRQGAGGRLHREVVQPDAVPGERFGHPRGHPPGRVPLAQARYRGRILLRRRRTVSDRSRGTNRRTA